MQSLEGINAGAKELLQHAKSGTAGPISDVIGLVADLVSVNVQHAAIVDVALGEIAQFVVVDGNDLINEIETQAVVNEWPLTDDFTQCRTCAFQTYCGREDAGVETAIITEDTDLSKFDSQLEPNLP